MKKQIVELGGYYAIRYKKWYHIRWRYIDKTIDHSPLPYIFKNCLCDTEHQAKNLIGLLTPKVIKHKTEIK